MPSNEVSKEYLQGYVASEFMSSVNTHCSIFGASTTTPERKIGREDLIKFSSRLVSILEGENSLHLPFLLIAREGQGNATFPSIPEKCLQGGITPGILPIFREHRISKNPDEAAQVQFEDPIQEQVSNRVIDMGVDQ